MKFLKSNNSGAESRISFYDGIDRAEDGRKLSAATIKHSTKQTVNLCKREKKGMSLATFCVLLAIILIVLVVIEFFAAYRPYTQMEAKQKELSEKQAQLDSLYGGMTDRAEVQNEYREYNYANFPFNLVDRQDVLAFIKEVIFPFGKITSVSVNVNTTSLTISEVAREDVDTLLENIRTDARVASLPMSDTEIKGDLVDVRVTITFKEATQGGKA